MKRITIILVSILLIAFSFSCKKKGCTNQYCDTYNEKAKEDDGSCGCNEGAVSVYVTRNDSEVDVYIDNVKKGRISDYFDGNAPTCGQDGTLRIELAPGVYQLTAISVLGREWNRQVEITEGNCSLQVLN